MKAQPQLRRLGREALPGDGSVPPIRVVHLGLGAFHRSHQAWYTAHAADAGRWGIAAYTGRSADAARLLSAQECVYTLVERGPVDERFELIGSIVRATSGDDIADFVETLAAPEVAVLTLTITEAGYRMAEDGGLDVRDPEVAADLAALRRRFAGPPSEDEVALATVPARILLGLAERRRRLAPPIAVVPCDNLPGNGAVISRVLTELAAQVDPELRAWLSSGVSFVSTSVDRITPRLTPADRERIASATGWDDASPIITELFSDWILCGEFPSGRPLWETAGARFVDDIDAWEARKLWMLNGAHTLLASSGRLRGHETVADAFGDSVCRAQVEALWDEAAAQLPGLETRDYRRALGERFTNPHIVHRLSQIAEGGLTKLRLRIAPVALAEREAGRPATGCATAIAAWYAIEASEVSLAELLHHLSPSLANDDAFVAEVNRALEEFDGTTIRTQESTVR